LTGDGRRPSVANDPCPRFSGEGDMLLVKTYLDRSPIHGLGVYAAERIRKGTKIWRFVEGFDRCYTPKQFARLPKQARDYLKSYAYRVDGEILFTVDNDHYINHSDEPNTYLHNGYAIAKVDIPKGREITNDYREFDPALCASFLKAGPAKRRK
jgi:SET domain-containing protein